MKMTGKKLKRIQDRRKKKYAKAVKKVAYGKGKIKGGTDRNKKYGGAKGKTMSGNSLIRSGKKIVKRNTKKANRLKPMNRKLSN